MVAVSNSRKMYFDEDGIPLKDWQSLLENGDTADKEAFLKACENMFDALVAKFNK